MTIPKLDNYALDHLGIMGSIFSDPTKPVQLDVWTKCPMMNYNKFSAVSNAQHMV